MVLRIKWESYYIIYKQQNVLKYIAYQILIKSYFLINLVLI